MPDFAQTGLITTLHDLGTVPLDRLESMLRESTATYKIGHGVGHARAAVRPDRRAVAWRRLC